MSPNSQPDDLLADIEAAKRFEDTVRRMANTPPEPKPVKRALRTSRSAEDEAIAALKSRITAYFRGLAGVPSRDDYIKAVLAGLPHGLLKTDLGNVTSATPYPSVVVSIDPLFDRLTAYAAEQWNNRHSASPTVLGAPKASS